MKQLSRKSPFSYQCNACGRCCYDKRIQITPYELLCMADFKNIDTTGFLLKYMDHNGPYLQRKDDGSCIFLTQKGCSIHPARPLVCRVYPLARFMEADGTEWFSEVAPHPETEGVYGTDGTVADYLDEQDVDPFCQGADRYFQLFYSFLDKWRAIQSDSPEIKEEAQTSFAETVSGPESPVLKWLDVDQQLKTYCSECNIPLPRRVDEKMSLHILALENWLESMNGRSSK